MNGRTLLSVLWESVLYSDRQTGFFVDGAVNGDGTMPMFAWTAIINELGFPPTKTCRTVITKWNENGHATSWAAHCTFQKGCVICAAHFYICLIIFVQCNNFSLTFGWQSVRDMKLWNTNFGIAAVHVFLTQFLWLFLPSSLNVLCSRTCFIFQIFGIVIACCLANSIRKDYESV